jgi:hypothetical protein
MASAVLISAAAAGDHQMVLECSRAQREFGLGPKVGADPAAALAVKDRHVGDP